MNQHFHEPAAQRQELNCLLQHGYEFDHPWQVIDIFEKKVAAFFGAPYAIAVDSCTHALELSVLLLNQPNMVIDVPVHTYMSVPMMLTKIRQPWRFVEKHWVDSFYALDSLPVVDAAFLWKSDSYQSGTLTSISFQHKKHIPIGRGGMILTDNYEHYFCLQKMCRDGRDRSLLQTQDDITDMGYHYYMTPEDGARGILLFDKLYDMQPVIKSWTNYKKLTEFKVFSNHEVF